MALNFPKNPTVGQIYPTSGTRRWKWNGEVWLAFYDIATYATLVDGKIPESQLPSYVDDVLEFDNLAAFPETGEAGKIYVAKDTNKTYRWSGSLPYVQISESLVLGNLSTTAYRGDYGELGYLHSQVTDGSNPHQTTFANVQGKPNSISGYGINDAYTQTEITAFLANKSDVGHTHDDRYYTETEVNNFLNNKQNIDTDLTTISALTTAGYVRRISDTNYVTDYNLAVNSVGFTNSVEYTTANAGELGWSTQYGTLQVGLLGGAVAKIGQTEYYFGKATENIAKGQVVMFNGAQGDFIKLSLAVPSVLNNNPDYMLGIAPTNITAEAFGYVTKFGYIDELPTNGFGNGTVLWYDSNIMNSAGGYTDTKPQAPNAKIQLAAVVKASSNPSAENGRLLVRVATGSQLGGTDSNVELIDIANNDLLIYNNVALRWENKNVNNITFPFTIANNSISDLNDVNATGAETDDVLSYNGTHWVKRTLVLGGGGTVTSVGLNMPTGFTVTNSPVTSSGNLNVAITSGYILPTTDMTNDYNAAYGWGNHANAGYLTSNTAANTYQAIGNYATLDEGGKVPSGQLPSYVDDVLEFANLSAFPGSGEDGKIYIAIDTSLAYRWSGSVFVEISPSLALGNTSSTAFRGDLGKTAYDWGNHAAAGYALNSAIVNAGNWDSAFSWGNHQAAGYAKTVTYTASLANTSWTGSGPFTKEVTVTGILSTDNPTIDVNFSTIDFADVANITSSWALVYRAVTTDNTVTFYATTVPSLTIPLDIKVVR